MTNEIQNSLKVTKDQIEFWAHKEGLVFNTISMTAFLVVRHDRHGDDRHFVYVDEKSALEKAKSIIGSYRKPNYVFEEVDEGDEDTIFYAKAGSSEDYVIFVKKIEVVIK
jgi:hypothetical protein